MKNIELKSSINVREVFNIDNELYNKKVRDFSYEIRVRKMLEKEVASKVKEHPNYRTEFLPIVEELSKLADKLHNIDKNHKEALLDTYEDSESAQLVKEITDKTRNMFETYLKEPTLDLISTYDLKIRLHIGLPEGEVISAKVFGELIQEIFEPNEILHLATQTCMNRAEGDEKKRESASRIKSSIIGGDPSKGLLGGIKLSADDLPPELRDMLEGMMGNNDDDE